MSPPFVFRIDEIAESPDANASTLVDSRGNWMPSTESGANIRMSGGVSGRWYFCDRECIRQVNHCPPNAARYKTFSVYFVGGFGFWVLRGDATSPGEGEAWQPLRFDWDQENFSSFLTNAGQQSTLRVQRTDQEWPKMLLPDIYQTTSMTPFTAYGGLKGELPLFLALVAFSVRKDYLASVLPTMFQQHEWRTHEYQHGRENLRGVVVYVYTCPSGSAQTVSPRDELQQYEEGRLGHYYN
ncbi:uncharacterized protein BDR25DRAFT_91572 [Lindgomyces ingoldianus]|uniref:Uncharacterized protein n=1 Tax=Lindgomyces ingoldianus TaxID=673940 RepID=A0ACB6QE40_9PLEO|nr:uncharacterized protein BDR25DRAFT_91572 [Lindgomyces ingoldianus]KAF2465213.1 hypothetical protein BDR25DRAFT_91572 [Lindgomyces ingoldianus]